MTKLKLAAYMSRVDIETDENSIEGENRHTTHGCNLTLSPLADFAIKGS